VASAKPFTAVKPDARKGAGAGRRRESVQIGQGERVTAQQAFDFAKENVPETVGRVQRDLFQQPASGGERDAAVLGRRVHGQKAEAHCVSL
jgi:hypothetical protein